MEISQGQILILHGWGSSGKSWNKVKESLNSLGYSVIIPDLPGFGQEPEPPKPWSVDDYVSWVEQFCIKNNLNNFLLLGHSFGGRVAIKFTAKYQERIKKLILFSAAGVTPRPKNKLSLLKILAKVINSVFSLPVLNLFENISRKVFYKILGNRDYYFLSSQIMRETFKKVIEEDLSSYLNKINTSTLIVWGEKDLMTPVSDAQKIHQEIPNSVLKIVPNENHYFYAKNPEKLVEAIKEFIV